MRGLILLLVTAVTCRAGYVGPPSPYGNPLIHSQPQRVTPSYAPPAPVGEDGNVIDTPEVAQAKAAHFAEFARAAARAAVDEKQQQHVYPATQPTAMPYLRQNDYQQPTPIYQAVNHVPTSIYNPLNYQQPQQYDGRANFVGQKNYALPPKPTAFVPAPLAEDGTVVDTPEVAALKAARLAELAEAEARAYKHASTQQHNPEENHSYSAPSAGPASVSNYLGSGAAVARGSYYGTQSYTNYQPYHYQSQHPIGKSVSQTSVTTTTTMRLLVLLSATSLLIGKSQQTPLYDYHGPWAPLANDGTVIDTPEVAQAKAEHLAAYAAADARVAETLIELSPTTRSATAEPLETNREMTQRDDSQKSVAPLGQNGQVVDTLEGSIFKVAAAKAKHLATHARAAATATSDHELDAYEHGNLLYLIRLVSPIAYRGPPAPLGSDGQVVDTPEVTVARSAHMKAHARAVALTTGYNVHFGVRVGIRVRQMSELGERFRMGGQVVLISTVAVTLATSAYYHGPPAPIGHDGRVLDTPEVTRAKAAHLAAVAEAAAKVPHSSSYSDNQNYHGYSKPVTAGHQVYHTGYGYRGPPAPLDHEGRVVDTPEVARAKAAHLAAYNHAASSAPLVAGEDHSEYYDSPSYGYHGPTAPLSHDGRVVDTPEIVLSALCAIVAARPTYLSYHIGLPLSPDGKILDTPEVAQAKAAHLAIQDYEAARNTGTLGYRYAFAVYPPAITYGAPIGADGRVVDTPEVAQAKAAHLAAHAQEAVKTVGLPYGALSTSWPYSYGYAPLGPDGRVIDTPEVALAKAKHLAISAQSVN
ncbi:PREDICTED: uncharacterized protein LOC106746648 [Dinoponera quadriceps]|uniref:Uncharacterized protein LOC106746648 n=1 Tax=Dinoponera quadriceps TaxID=609295 RepID=A0A6P3XKJ8_DINQU|nr:PREDICTED: uncharacterized protein LOC106746648 [Dinoponera quadriceps]